MPNELVIIAASLPSGSFPSRIANWQCNIWISGNRAQSSSSRQIFSLPKIASLLAKKHRRKELSAQQAIDAYGFISTFAPKLEPSPTLMPLALNLSLQHQLSLWDATYLALAIQKSCALVTADIRLFRGGKARHPAISLLTSL